MGGVEGFRHLYPHGIVPPLNFSRAFNPNNLLLLDSCRVEVDEVVASQVLMFVHKPGVPECLQVRLKVVKEKGIGGKSKICGHTKNFPIFIVPLLYIDYSL